MMKLGLAAAMLAGCCLVAGAGDAEARAGKGRGLARMSAAPAKPVAIAPAGRRYGADISIVVAPRASRRPYAAAGTAAAPAVGGFGLASAASAGQALAAEKEPTAAPGCAADRLVGSGAGFCQIN